MNANRLRSRLAVIPLAALTLVACGGGGDTPPHADTPTPAAAAPAPAPTTPTPAPAQATGVVVPDDVRSVAASGGSDINSSNYASLGASMGRAAAGSTSNPLIDDGVVAARETRRALAESSSGEASALPAWIGTAAAQMRARGGRERPAAVESETVDCQHGGTITTTANDADDNKKVSAGDSVKLVANECSNDASAPPLSGSFEIAINAIELNERDEATALDASGRFIDFRAGTVSSLDGAFRLWAKTDSATQKRLRLSLRDVKVTHLSDTAVFNLDMRVAATPTMTALAIDGGIAVNGQTYSMVQVKPFTVDASGVPTGGSLRLSDGQGDAVLMRAGAGGRVDYDYLPVGSSTAAHTTPNQSWNNLKR